MSRQVELSRWPTAPRRWLALLLLALVGCGGGYSPEPPGPPKKLDRSTQRTLGLGPVQGFVDRHGAQAWLGLPFAAPPIGELRWRAPRPPQPWTGTRAALQFPDPCMQIGSPLGGATPDQVGQLIGKEDCLYLNVWSPPGTGAGSGLPVMVWIHGGGNVIGTSAFYNGAKLATDQRVVVVTVQFRLGPFGWYRHPLLASNDSALDGSGNYGTLDLIAALQWVRDHIDAFGGDAGNVTVFGESAGGTNVMSLVLSPPAEGLFHRAISQSGGARFATVDNAANYVDAALPGDPQSGAEIAVRALLQAGVGATRADVRAAIDGQGATGLRKALQAIPAAKFYGLYASSPGSLGPNHPRVIADDVVIRSGDPHTLLATGAAPAVPLMLGTNRDEPRIFMVFDPKQVQRLFGIPLWPRDAAAYAASSRFGGMAWKVRGVDDLAAAAVAGGNSQVFAYRWDWDEEGKVLGLLDMGELLGAAHGLEIPFVFGYWDLGSQSSLMFTAANADGRQLLSSQMRGYWAEFARTGNPGTGGGRAPRWPAWGAGSTALLDTAADGGITTLAGRLTNDAVVDAIAQEISAPPLRCAVFADAFRSAEPAWLAAGRNRLGCAPASP